MAFMRDGGDHICRTEDVVYLVVKSVIENFLGGQGPSPLRLPRGQLAALAGGEASNMSADAVNSTQPGLRWNPMSIAAGH